MTASEQQAESRFGTRLVVRSAWGGCEFLDRIGNSTVIENGTRVWFWGRQALGQEAITATGRMYAIPDAVTVSDGGPGGGSWRVPLHIIITDRNNVVKLHEGEIILQS